MFADKLSNIISRRDPILWAKTYHQLAVKLVSNDDLMYTLFLSKVDKANIECGFCPCGKGLIVFVVNQKNSWSKPVYQGDILCKDCQRRFELQYQPKSFGTSLRSGDLIVYCLSMGKKYQMVVRPLYLWQMESTLKDYVKII